MDYEIKLTFITPMFSHGATDGPEICSRDIGKYYKDIMELGKMP